jgi:hypothetical protein
VSEPAPASPPAAAGVPRWRRLVGMGALAVAACLVVVTLLGLRRHDLRLVLELAPAFQASLERVVIEVLEETGETRLGQADLRFPDAPPAGAPEHTFQLRAGRYHLEFTLYPRGAGVPVHARRELEVVGAARVVFALP